MFSKRNAARDCHQTPVVSEDITNAAIITRFGLYAYLRMYFGTNNVLQTFQRLMDTVFQNVHCSFVYLYDIIILLEYSEDIRLVCQRRNNMV